MTDAEKMLHLMNELSKQSEIQIKSEMNTMAKTMRISYEAFVNAGYTPHQALELNKELIRSAMMSNGTKK